MASNGRTDGHPAGGKRVSGQQADGGRSDAATRRAERGLRELAGTGRSQLGVSKAMRARDVDRPTSQDVADAERTIEIVRRNWRPAD